MKKTLKVRHYVMGMALRAGNSSVKLPSLRDLEKQLDVSRGTLVAALKELSDDGYLITRNGVGYFTRPTMLDIPFDISPPKMLGYISNSGKNFYIGGSTFFYAPDIFREFRERSWRLHCRNLEGHSTGEFFREIISWKCDALFWSSPEESAFPLLRKLIKAGLPILTNKSLFADASSVYTDMRAPHLQMRREFIRCGWKKILFCGEKHLSHLRFMLPENEKDISQLETIFFDSGTDRAAERLSEKLAEFDGNAVLCDERTFHFVQKFQRENNSKFQVLKHLQYIGENGKIYAYHPDFKEHARKVALELEDLMNGSTEIREISIGGEFFEWHGEATVTL